MCLRENDSLEVLYYHIVVTLTITVLKLGFRLANLLGCFIVPLPIARRVRETESSISILSRLVYACAS